MIENNDLLKKIKGLFIVSDGETSAETINNTPANDVTTNYAGTVSVSDDGNVVMNEKHVQMLMTAIQQNNMEGFDYLEYKNSLKSISNVISDETMRYKSAFEMAKTMGLDKKKLLDSAAFYLNVLGGEQKKFLDAIENQKSKQIQGRVNTIEDLDNKIVEKKKTIEQLNKDLESINEQMSVLKKEINEEVTKIEVTNKQFMASYEYVTSQIKEDIEKINTNI
ncbi:MAG TPA: hypothetical protein PK047_02860 [Saprospiraceae bacterium]|nr:hypothetical protein [Saprospiraceae bacterium]HRO07776.1 hypothetical protein [Saprospiraceae bacterium]HRP40998.1 hypothetical protein [Saprospiraceae bacterium]